MKQLLLVTITLFVSALSTFAATWYVNTNATGSASGTNWTDAFTDLQDAITASAFGDEIWVAAGTYKPTATTDRAISFVIKNGTKVYGGFTGTETVLSERDPVVNETVLSGEIATSAFFDNSYHVVYFLNVINQTRIDGFTIRLGCAIGDALIDAGGGILSNNSSAVVENCRFVENRADFGGGMAHVNTGITTLKNSVFEGNISFENGGALYLENDQGSVTDCYFTSNQSNDDAGAVYIGDQAFSFDRCVFAGNTCVDDGSAFYVGNFATLHLSNSLLVGNYAGGQEVISMNEQFNTQVNSIINCTVAHNRQLQNGAGTRAITMNAVSSIYNSIIWNNGGASQVLATGTTMSNCIQQIGANNQSGTNILTADPLFVVPGNLAAAPFDTTGLDYHLTLFSSGIDAGLNAQTSGSTDLDGNVRIQNTVDLGAYENTFCASPLTFDQPAPYTICGGTPLTLSVTGAVEYAWSTGATGTAITVGSAGIYSVVFEDANGCRGSLSATVGSSSNPAPSITFSGGNLSTGSFSTYQWFFNNNPINGATGATHIPLEGYGQYSVAVTNAAGCEGSATYCLSPAMLSADGPTTFCSGGSLTLTAENGNAFVWSNGELDDAITVSTAGTYTVTVLNQAAGCAVTLSQQVTVFADPVPVITYSGGNLVTGAFATYQWYFNGNPINGATAATLAPDNGNGTYTVVVTDANGCEGTAAAFNYSNVGLNALTATVPVLFPNPATASGLLYVSANSSEQPVTSARLYDLSGKLCVHYTGDALSSGMQLNGVQPGIYWVELTTDEAVIARLRLVVQ